MFEKTPHTRVAVHPVSAIIFGGVMEATRNYGGMTLAPREGLAEELKARGTVIARELGLVDDAA